MLLVRGRKPKCALIHVRLTCYVKSGLLQGEKLSGIQPRRIKRKANNEARRLKATLNDVQNRCNDSTYVIDIPVRL